MHYCKKSNTWYEGHLKNKGNLFLKKRKENNNFLFSFHKCKHCIIWNWFIATTILISQKYLFKGYLKWWQISVPDLNKGLSKDFWQLRRAHHQKFTKECVMYIEKHVLVKKNVYRWIKQGFITLSLSQKDSLESGSTLT